MRIVHLQVENYRGIHSLEWTPGPSVNCLIGPGDSSKTTILDAIQMVLTPRTAYTVDDSDFPSCDVSLTIRITVTVTGFPEEFKSEDRYGLHLRGWDSSSSRISDEPADGLDDAVSLRVTIDRSLEPRWTIYNERIGDDCDSAPALRYRDSQRLLPTRLGAYADRHLAWGRSSALSRLAEEDGDVGERLAEAGRAARESFRQGGEDIFRETAKRAEGLGRLFSVPVREGYSAELDVQSVTVSSGGISLHDGGLALRRLGTGSSRLLVSALQREAGVGHVALVDELEHGLEPHRIARLVKQLRTPTSGQSGSPQMFVTTHSPVVVREMQVEELYCTDNKSGALRINALKEPPESREDIQRLVRAEPEALLARRVVVTEGRTELGVLRALDDYWVGCGQESFAFRGVVVVDGGGDDAPRRAKHLLRLGFGCMLLIDGDKEELPGVEDARALGGQVVRWPDSCSTEERIFLDVPWHLVRDLILQAADYLGHSGDIITRVNERLTEVGCSQIHDLSLPESLDTVPVRRALGVAAKGNRQGKGGWFKGISRGEDLGARIGAALSEPKVSQSPLGQGLAKIREWVDEG